MQPSGPTPPQRGRRVVARLSSSVHPAPSGATQKLPRFLSESALPRSRPHRAVRRETQRFKRIALRCEKTARNTLKNPLILKVAKNQWDRRGARPRGRGGSALGRRDFRPDGRVLYRAAPALTPALSRWTPRRSYTPRIARHPPFPRLYPSCKK